MSIVGDFVSNSIGIHYQLRLPDSRLGLQAMTRGAGSASDVFFSRNSPHQLPINPDDVFLTEGIGEDSRVGAYLHLIGTGRLDDISFLAPIGPSEISTLLGFPEYQARFNNVLSLSEILPHGEANKTYH
ncbi:MAG: hypothetical protein IPJ69_13050 [Deltaproteobacteria bacterium]|nr:MAG: hypothetical protein IPJ69_13050 [Deltaproteobacteria bacterium]